MLDVAVESGQFPGLTSLTVHTEPGKRNLVSAVLAFHS